MRIAFHLNCLEQGGAERVVSNLANQFAREGVEVYVTTQWYGENEFVLDERVKRVHVGLREEDAKKNRLLKYYLRIKYLKDFIRQEKPDVLVAFAQKAIFRSIMAAEGTKCPVCACVRANPLTSYNSRASRLKIKLLLHKAKGFVFQTEAQRDFFPKYARENSIIILNPVHQKYIDEPMSEGRRKEVVQSGRLVDFKNQAMLVDAFMEVHKKHPDYVLKIYGPDSLDGTKEILEQKIRDYRAEEFILLPGGSDNLEKELKDAAVFAFSSNHEGLPNTLLEAMALGLPVVATDCPCGGPATVIHNYENGILVPIKNAEEMAKGICYMIEHPKEAEEMAKNAARIAEITNAHTVFEQWKGYLEALSKQR